MTSRPGEITLTFKGQDAIDLARLAKIAGKTKTVLAKSMVCEVLADDRVAHAERGRVA